MDEYLFCKATAPPFWINEPFATKAEKIKSRLTHKLPEMLQNFRAVLRVVFGCQHWCWVGYRRKERLCAGAAHEGLSRHIYPEGILCFGKRLSLSGEFQCAVLSEAIPFHPVCSGKQETLWNQSHPVPASSPHTQIYLLCAASGRLGQCQISAMRSSMGRPECSVPRETRITSTRAQQQIGKGSIVFFILHRVGWDTETCWMLSSIKDWWLYTEITGDFKILGSTDYIVPKE